MLIVLEKEGKRERVSVEERIARSDRVEIDTDPHIPLATPYKGGPIPKPAINREIYYRTDGTVDGHPVFKYRSPVNWVEGKPGSIYKVQIGRFALSVHRHVDYPSHLWFATCHGLLCRHELKSLDLEDAKDEALGLVRNILNTVLIDMEELPCR